MLHVLARAVTVLLIDSPYGAMTMYLGFTQHGMPVEVGTVDDPHDGEVIIHAMPMRKAFRDKLRRQGG